MVLEGFEGWRHPSELQNELLETLEAGLGVDEVLRGSWMICWRLGGGSCSVGAWPGWLAGRPKAESTRSVGGKMMIAGLVFH